MYNNNPSIKNIIILLILKNYFNFIKERINVLRKQKKDRNKNNIRYNLNFNPVNYLKLVILKNEKQYIFFLFNKIKNIKTILKYYKHLLTV